MTRGGVLILRLPAPSRGRIATPGDQAVNVTRRLNLAKKTEPEQLMPDMKSGEAIRGGHGRGELSKLLRPQQTRWGEGIGNIKARRSCV
eukprot:4236849-Pleurochrysis_carterae.AAC.9